MEVAESANQFHTIPITCLAPSPTNPRKAYDQAGLAELAESIKAKGIILPLIARPRSTDDSGESQWSEIRPLEIVCGERRYRAAKLAGLEAAPVQIRQLTDQEALELQIIENLQRADVTPLEEAESYQSLLKSALANVFSDQPQPKETVESIAKRVGKSKEYVYARLKLLNLAKKPRELMATGKISASHGVLLARLSEKDQAAQLKEMARWGSGPDGDSRMSVRELNDQIEQRIRKAEADTRVAAVIKQLEDKGTEYVQVSTRSYDPERPKGALGPEKWREVTEGCLHPYTGVIVSDQSESNRGKLLQVCIDPKCKEHKQSRQGEMIGRSKEDREYAERQRSKQKAGDKKRKAAAERAKATIEIILDRFALPLKRDLELIATSFILETQQDNVHRLRKLYGEAMPLPWPESAGKFTSWVESLLEVELYKLLIAASLISETQTGNEFYSIKRTRLEAAAARYKVTDQEIDAQLVPSGKVPPLPKEPLKSRGSRPKPAQPVKVSARLQASAKSGEAAGRKKNKKKPATKIAKKAGKKKHG